MTILKGIFIAAGTEPDTVITGTHLAQLDCGCSIVVGRRSDNNEAATGAIPCSDEHRPLMDDANKRIQHAIQVPGSADRRVIDTAHTALLDAYDAADPKIES